MKKNAKEINIQKYAKERERKQKRIQIPKCNSHKKINKGNPYKKQPQ